MMLSSHYRSTGTNLPPLPSSLSLRRREVVACRSQCIRPPITNMPSCDLPVISQEYGYLDAMYTLMYIISRRINPDAMANATYEQVVDICDDVKKIPTRLVPRIQFKDQCKTVRDRLQHFAISLHTAFVVSVACRPALRRDCAFLPEQKAYLAAECKRNLIITVKMFLAMHQLSVIPTRSWAFTYNGLSSALLLGILVNTKADPEIRQLQGDLIAALSATAAKEQEPEGPKKTDKDIELSGPLWRALMALKNIYKHGSIVGAPVKMDREAPVAGENEQPPAQPVPGAAVAAGTQEGGHLPVGEGVDPTHDAARTMAELQRQTMQPSAPMPDYTRYGRSLHSRRRLASANANLIACLLHKICHRSPWTTWRPLTRTSPRWTCTTLSGGVSTLKISTPCPECNVAHDTSQRHRSPGTTDSMR